LRIAEIPTPPPPVLLAKSAESLENKRVDFLGSAKKRKRVLKILKIKEIGRKE